MKLIENKSQWHRLWSVRLAILSAVLLALELSLPLWQVVFPAHVFAALATITSVASAVARVIKQEALGNGD